MGNCGSLVGGVGAWWAWWPRRGADKKKPPSYLAAARGLSLAVVKWGLVVLGYSGGLKTGGGGDAVNAQGHAPLSLRRRRTAAC